jgi:MFS family permease
MVVVWLSSFSGALQSPVVSFFLLQLGMTPVGIGQVGFITAMGALFLGPIYGLLMDAKNPYAVVVLSTSLCGLGCLLRGVAVNPTMVYAAATVMMLGAPMEPMVMAYICRTQHAFDRAATVAGFLAQSSALSLAGKAAYPMWDAVVRDGLHVQDTMHRYRLVLAACIAPCVAGFVLLAALWRRQRRSLVSLTQATHVNRPHRPAPVVYALVASTIVVKQFATITTNVLWPLFVRKFFGWEDTRYSLVLFISAATSLAAMGCAGTRHVGTFADPMIAMFIASLSGVAAFSVTLESAAHWHSVLAICNITALSFANPCLTALACEHMPQHWQGRSFGITSSLNGAGAIAANLLATYLFQYFAQSGWLLPLPPSSAPFCISAALLWIGMATLFLARRIAVGLDAEAGIQACHRV